MITPDKHKEWVKNQRSHTKNRFKERFNINFNKHIRRDIVKNIINKKYELLEKQSDFREAYFIIIDDKPLVLIFDTKSKNVVTCLFYSEFIDNLVLKMGKDRNKRIRQRIQEITGINFNASQNKSIALVIHYEIKKLRDLIKEEYDKKDEKLQENKKTQEKTDL